MVTKNIEPDVCSQCGGRLTEGTMNEYGVQCDTCNFPYVVTDFIKKHKPPTLKDRTLMIHLLYHWRRC